MLDGIETGSKIFLTTNRNLTNHCHDTIFFLSSFLVIRLLEKHHLVFSHLPAGFYDL